MEPPFQQKLTTYSHNGSATKCGDSVLQQKLCKLASLLMLSMHALGMPSLQCGISPNTCGIVDFQDLAFLNSSTISTHAQ